MKLGKTSVACYKALIFLKYKALLQIRENPNLSESKNGPKTKMGHSQKKKLLTNEDTKSSTLSIRRKKMKQAQRAVFLQSNQPQKHF